MKIDNTSHYYQLCSIHISTLQTILDEIVEKLPDEFNMMEIMNKVPPEERTPYVIVAFQECERMNTLTNELKRSLKELDLGLKVCLTSQRPFSTILLAINSANFFICANCIFALLSYDTALISNNI